jgi:autotransporter-associated beta strand protein
LGLLDNGKELWFSFLYKSTRTGGINDQTGFALGTDGINTTNVVPMLNSGNGIGVSIDREARVNASVWAGGTRATDAKTDGIPAYAATLIVGKIKWGTTDTDVETVTIYLPGADLVLPAEKSTKSTAAAMNQSTFDTISFGNKGDAGAVVTFDEIRFGASYADVVPVETAAPTLVSITDNLLGGPIGEDVAIITYDLIFDKSMDLATFDTKDFNNADGATATISIGTITQPSPNVIRVEVLPRTTGTVQLRIPATSVIKSLVQANLDTTADILDDTTITINSGATPPDLPTTNRWWDGAVTSGATNGASGGGTGAWSTTTTNWDRGAGFENPVGWDNAAGTTAIFGGTAGTVTLDEDEEINIKNLTFTHTTGTYTITGSALNFTSGTITASNPPTNVVNAIIRSNITGSPALNLKLMDGDRQFTLNPAASGSMIIGAVTGDTGNGSEKLNLQGGAGSTGTIASVSGPKWIQTSGTWTLNGNASGYGHSITGGTLTLNANITATNRSVTLGAGVINYNVANAVSATAATATAGDNGFRLQTGASIDQTSGVAITTSTTNPSMSWEGNWTFIGTNGANSNLNLGTSNVFLRAANLQVSVTDAATTLTVGGVIANDVTGGRGLTKAGAGTLELRGANTYTGPTTVNAGTLKLDTSGALDAAGRVSIAAGATLDLTAKTAESATYTWNTTSLSASGAATPTTITGTAQGTIHMGIKSISLTTDGTNPSLTVTGATLTLGNNPFTVVVPGPALTNGVYPLVSADSITGTVNPAASYTGGNGLAGGATGVVSISGNTVILTVTGGDPFASWAGAGVAFDADANNDGVDNGLAWVLGAANPSANALPLLPAMDNTTDPDFFIFTYRRDDDANTDPNTTIKAEYGSTLSGWTPAVAGPDIIITPTDDFYPVGIDMVQVKIRRTLAVGGKLFARLNVQNTP